MFLPLLYLFYVVGLLWTDNMDEGTFDLEVKMSLILFPLVFALRPVSKIRLKKCIQYLIVALGINFLYLLAITVFNSDTPVSLSSFFYVNLSQLIHPSYMAFYVNTLLILVVYDYFKGVFNLFANKNVYVLVMGFLAIFSLLLVSKVGLLVSGIVLCWMLLQWMLKKQYLLVVTVLAVSIGGIFSTYKTSDYVANRIDEFFEGVGDGPQDNYLYSTSIRLVVWDVAWQNVLDAPLTGYGTGDVGDVLLEDYIAEDIVRVKDLNLNAHNQFLQTLLAIGVGGFVVLLMVLIIPLIKFKGHRVMYVLFLLNVVFFFYSESVLETQAGTVAFALFYVLFVNALHAIQKEPSSIESV